MKIRCKRFPAMLFAFLLLLSTIFLCSFSTTEDFFQYSIDDNGDAVIVGYRGYERELTIPASVDGKKVVAVAETAFYGNTILRKITVSASIERVEKDAFAYCENLNAVYFEDGCSFIGEAAFEGCTLLETVRLPNNLSIIDDFAFQGCTRLGKVEMPSTLSSIGYNAFMDCESLVFAAENSPVAKSYAEENNIDLSFGESSTFLWLEVVGGVAGLLLLLLAVRFVWKKMRQRQAAGNASPEKDAAAPNRK